jgi:pterin-4a-carbinolamine dehydratase
MAALSDDEIQAKLSELDGWELKGDAIEKQFQFKDFTGSVDFVNEITPTR